MSTCKLFSSLTLLTVMSFGMVAQKPIITTKYTADPAPYVHGDTVYLYTTHDEDDAEGFKMFDWLLYTSTDMVNWTDHGAVASLADFKWYGKDNGAWAEQVIERNGKWYMYCPIHGNGISVLVADSPYGPFKDPLGKPLVWQKEHWYDIDPTVWIDDDGQAYMYWGNPNLYYVKLNEDMISYSGTIQQMPKIDDYQEGPWFYKRGNNYYMAFASTCCPEGIGYAMSQSPTGPWTAKGDIMPHTQLSRGNHPGIIDYKGKSYVFGLNYLLWAGHLKKDGLAYRHAERRSVSVAEMKYNEDGTIQKVDFWPRNGVAQVEAFNPYHRVEAETMSWSELVKTRKSDKVGNMILTNIKKGAYTCVSGVDFGKGAASFSANVLNVKAKSSITIRLDHPAGEVIGAVEFSADGNAECDLTGACGKHDIYLTFDGDFEFDYWSMKESETEVKPLDKYFPAVTNIRGNQYPKVAKDGTALFRLVAPDAHEVKVDIGGVQYPMVCDKNGVWMTTVAPQLRGINYYFLIVDGVSVNDPGSETFYGCSRSSSCIEIPYEEGGERFEPRKDIARGEVTMRRYFSKTHNEWRRMYIYLPAGYHQSKQKYPVLYLQHGGGEDERGWSSQGRTDIILDNLIAEGKAVPMIIAMCDGNCQDFTAEIANECIPVVEANYRAIANADNRGIAGLSMGGIMTLNLMIDKPELFRYYGVFSSGWWAQRSSFFPVDNDKNYKKLAEQKDYYNKQMKVLWLSMGAKEDIAYNNCQVMMKRFDECGIKYEYWETPGGHTWPVWRESIYRFAQMIFKK